ncbi:MAG: MFS transporter [Candidatus Pacebacteria bacterium]|nr:MFS transporter [Candidatus Paceibacterota bacterium]MDD4875076.1 MFS transporter [Candidatus Paceibacterota bacterium]
MESSSAKKENNLKTFTIASFLNDFGSDIISPIWPLFVTSFAGANMAVLGLIDGLGEAIVSISQAASGYFSDKTRKRKVFVWLGYIFGAASRVGYALANAWQCLVPFRVLDRAGKMRGAPRDAIIADFSNDGDRGSNFGVLRAFDNLGAVCGILFSIAMLDVLGYRSLFLLAAIPSLIGAALIFANVKEPKTKDKFEYKEISLKDFDGNFKLFLALSAVFAFGSFSYSFLLVFANKFGFAVAAVPVLYLLFTLVASVFSIPFGRLSDKIKSRKKILMISYVCWLFSCSLFVISQSWISIVLAFIFYGLYKGAADTVQTAFVAELSPKDRRASGLGGFKMVVGLWALPASFVAGILWDSIGTTAPFYFSIVLTVISITALFFVKEKKLSRIG